MIAISFDLSTFFCSSLDVANFYVPYFVMLAHPNNFIYLAKDNHI